jgi:predicted metal-binding membrane protein
MQHGQAASTNSIGMQHGDMAMEHLKHGHVIQNVPAKWSFMMNKQYGHTTWTTAITSSMDMQQR